MNLCKKEIRSLLLLFTAVTLLSGCLPTMKSNVPQLEARVEKFDRVVLLTPNIEIFELNAAEMREKRDEWSAKGEKNVEKAIIKILREKGVRVYPLRKKGGDKEELEEIQLLYRAVAASIYNHVRGMYPFPDRVKNFDYSIGPVNKFLKKHNADGLLIVYGVDEISTKGRKALEVVRAINIFGSGRHGGGVTALEMGLTDGTGAVLWLRIKGNSGGYDLREPESAQAFVKNVLDEYPRGAK